jgi:hypothetical protein
MSGICAAEEVRPLTLEQVEQVVEKNDRAVQACARGRHDTMAVLLRLEIEADGRVSSAAPTMEKPPAETGCVMRVAKKLRFPESGTHSRIDYPFMLMSKSKLVRF